MKQLIKKQAFDFTIDKAFAEVINNCKTSPRKDQDGTWITNEVKAVIYSFISLAMRTAQKHG